MNFLLVNDDGITAPGLWAAAHALAEIGKVMVVAPSLNYSGYGAALPPAREVGCKPFPSPGAKVAGIPAFSVAASPAACVQIGLSGVLSKMSINLVVSGINQGANIGRDVLYSGTVGAALTACLLGKSAIAASLDVGPAGVAHWDTAAWCIQEVVKSMGNSPQPDPALLNVNVPNRPLTQLAGIEITGLSSTLCLQGYDIRMAGEDLLRFERQPAPVRGQDEPCSDAWALAHGRVSVTPLRLFPDILYLSGWQDCPERLADQAPALA